MICKQKKCQNYIFYFFIKMTTISSLGNTGALADEKIKNRYKVHPALLNLDNL